jgi:putative ABC transport system permease protein
MPHVYLPFAQDSATPGSLFVRTAGDPRSLLGRVRREVQGLRGDLPYAQVQLMEELIAPQLRPWRLGASMFLIFGLLALAISAVGLYGVVAYLAAQRTREIGVRMALGARAKDVVRLVVRDGLRDAAIGLVVGVAATLAAGRFVASLLFGVRASDPASLVLAGAVLLVVAALAALVPAWRAAHVDPTVALRAE